MRNPKGLEVEVRDSEKESLLAKGFSILDPKNIRSNRPRKKLDLVMPGSQYPYGGYGRVVELLYEMFEFSPESPNKLHIGYPRPITKSSGRDLLITAFEADRLPEDWLELCKQFDAIIVPSQWCREVFLSSGVTVPVEVMVQGATNFDVVTISPPHPPFKFLHYNAFSDFKRKGWDLVIKAFTELFGEDEKVQLILKGRLHDNEKDVGFVPKTHNIKIIVQNMKRGGMDALLADVHCFVFPSRGEGIGLPPIEAMARGIPAIITDGSGMKEYSDLGISIEASQTCGAKYDLGVHANWIEPDIGMLKKAMWNVYKNYNLYKDLAVDKAKEVKRRYSLDRQSAVFEEIVNKYVSN